MSQVLFFLAAIAAITGAIGVVALRNPFYAVLALVFHLVALAALFLLLRAEFVAASQVVVYAGAVMVLYVFVVAYVGGGEEMAAGVALRVLGPLFALALAVELCLAMLGSALKGINSKGAPYIPGFGSPRHIGQLFLTTYLFPFEIASLLLLVAAIGALSGAVAVVTLRNPFYSVLALVGHLISLAALFLLLRAEFVAAAQVVVYAGAVMVLYVFVVAYIGGQDEELRGGTSLRFLGPVFAVAVAVELCLATLGSALKGISGKGAPYVPGFGTPQHIGRLFLTTYLFPFEIASLLLMVAAIGAVVLAGRRRGLEPIDDEDARVQTRRPSLTGTMAEGAGIRWALNAVEAETQAERERERVGSGLPATPPREGGW